MRLILIIAFVSTLTSAMSMAQECGPGCPTCSGSGNSSNSLLNPGTFSVNYLYIPEGEEETGIMNLRTGITSWMDGGIGYAFKAEQVVWNLRIQPISEVETSCRPAVLIGTGSVRTGDSDQSLYLQAIKTFEIKETFSLRLSAGAASLIPDFNELYGLSGATLTYQDSWSTYVNYDGKSVHPGISWNPTEWLTLAATLIESETPAVFAGIQFGI